MTDFASVLDTLTTDEPQAREAAIPTEKVAELGNLLTLDTVRERLAQTEPLSSITLETGKTKFRLGDEWEYQKENSAASDSVDAFAMVDGHEYQLTLEAALAATSAVGLPTAYVRRTPGALIAPQLNYWFNGGLDPERKFLVVGDQARAVTRSTITPFSNLQLLDRMLASLENKYGKATIYADQKFTHSLTGTYMRLIVPEHVRTITGTGTDNDTWSVGVQLRNSLIGKTQTEVMGYLFRWACTNGALDVRHSSGGWSRKSALDDESIYLWAEESVTGIMEHVDEALDGVQALTTESVVGEASDILRDFFARERISSRIQGSIVDYMLNDDNVTMYAMMQAVTQAANDPHLAPEHVEKLMLSGGNIATEHAARCESCHRVV